MGAKLSLNRQRVKARLFTIDTDDQAVASSLPAPVEVEQAASLFMLGKSKNSGTQQAGSLLYL
jgi:hypothetical protein